jgi:hypothetical protein
MAVKLVTSEVTLSYVTLFEPRSIVEGGTPKYSVSVLIPKTDKALIAQINKAVEKAIDEGQGKLKTRKGLKLPMRDGDEEKDSAEYEGHFFISANSNDAPMVVDQDRQAVIDPREVYSGCKGRVSINFYAYNTGGNKGIAAGLNAVQKTADGEALGGSYTKASMEDDFADEGDDLL